MTKLPSHITLGGHDIKIVKRKLDDRFGECDEPKRLIQIDPDIHKDSGIDVRSTLFHECIHMALGLSGLSNVLDDSQEEAVVKCLENLLYPALPKIIGD